MTKEFENIDEIIAFLKTENVKFKSFVKKGNVYVLNYEVGDKK